MGDILGMIYSTLDYNAYVATYLPRSLQYTLFHSLPCGITLFVFFIPAHCLSYSSICVAALRGAAEYELPIPESKEARNGSESIETLSNRNLFIEGNTSSRYGRWCSFTAVAYRSEAAVRWDGDGGIQPRFILGLLLPLALDIKLQCIEYTGMEGVDAHV